MGRTDEVQFMLECVAEWRRLGARVTFEPGWETRGNGTQGNYEGGIVHHTTGKSSAANPLPTKNTLLHGRPDLSGPLCNVAGPWCTEADPWLHVVGAFPANHAGASGGKSMGPLPTTSLFNPRVLGLEVDYAGTSPMTGGQRKAALIFTRGLTNVLKRSTEYVRAHAETSVTGKWDAGYAAGKTIDMAAFRREAAALTAPSLEDWMSALTDAEQRALYNRVMGFQRQRWYIVKDGKPVGVPEGTEGAQPAVALDTLDGNWLTEIITGGTQTVMGEVSSAFHQEADRDAANQAALSAQLTNVGGGDPAVLAAALRSALGETLAADVAARLTVTAG